MGKIIFRGFLGVAPIVITIALVVWLYEECENLFRVPLMALLGPKYYFPGLGVILALIVIFFIGLIINTWVIQWIQHWIEQMLKKIPLVKTVYESVCDLMSFFHQGGQSQSGKVVMVELMGTRLIGLMTRETFDDLPKGVAGNDEVAVFLPFSYQLGGMTVFIPKEKVHPIDMSVEKALRFVVTAAAPTGANPSGPPQRKKRKKSPSDISEEDS